MRWNIKVVYRQRSVIYFFLLLLLFSLPSATTEKYRFHRGVSFSRQVVYVMNECLFGHASVPDIIISFFDDGFQLRQVSHANKNPLAFLSFFLSAFVSIIPYKQHSSFLPYFRFLTNPTFHRHNQHHLQLPLTYLLILTNSLSAHFLFFFFF